MYRVNFRLDAEIAYRVFIIVISVHMCDVILYENLICSICISDAIRRKNGYSRSLVRLLFVNYANIIFPAYRINRVYILYTRTLHTLRVRNFHEYTRVATIDRNRVRSFSLFYALYWHLRSAYYNIVLHLVVRWIMIPWNIWRGRYTDCIYTITVHVGGTHVLIVPYTRLFSAKRQSKIFPPRATHKKYGFIKCVRNKT